MSTYFHQILTNLLKKVFFTDAPSGTFTIQESLKILPQADILLCEILMSENYRILLRRGGISLKDELARDPRSSCYGRSKFFNNRSYNCAMLRRARCCHGKSSVCPSVTLRYCDDIGWNSSIFAADRYRVVAVSGSMKVQ